MWDTCLENALFHAGKKTTPLRIFSIPNLVVIGCPVHGCNIASETGPRKATGLMCPLAHSNWLQLWSGAPFPLHWRPPASPNRSLRMGSCTNPKARKTEPLVPVTDPRLDLQIGLILRRSCLSTIFLLYWCSFFFFNFSFVLAFPSQVLSQHSEILNIQVGSREAAGLTQKCST